MPEETQPRKRLLFIDDDPSFVAVLAEQMRLVGQGGWEVETAADAASALSLLQQKPFNLVTIDLQMPTVDGQQLLALISRRFPNLQKVVLTGLGTDELRAACLSLGADLFLEKPTTAADFEVVGANLAELMKWQTEEGFRGVLRKVGLEDVIQMECLSRHSTVLEISGRTGSGEIFIEEGRVVHAASGELNGLEAFNYLLTLRGGEFRLKSFTPPPSSTITDSWEFLLMEAARLRDEIQGREEEAKPTPPPRPVAPIPPPVRPPVDGRGQRRFEPPSDSIPDIVFSKSIPAPRRSPSAEPEPAVSRSGKMDLPPLPPETEPVVEEVVFCGGGGDIFYEKQSPNTDKWVQFLEFVSQKSRQLSHGLSIGEIERLVIRSDDMRLLVRVGADHGVVVRARASGPDAVQTRSS